MWPVGLTASLNVACGFNCKSHCGQGVELQVSLHEGLATVP
jgi:hypothetical protein